MDNINTTNNNIKPQLSPISPADKEKKSLIFKRQLLIGLGFTLVIIILIVSILTQEEKKQTIKTYKLEDIFTSSEKIISSQIAPNNIYAFATTQKSIPVQNTFNENEDGCVVLVGDNLIFVNLTTQEKKEFDLYKLASKEIIDPLKTIPVPVQYKLYINLLEWSADSNDFWGAINLVPSADPPVNDSISLFKIDTKDWSIEKFTLPGRFINSLGKQSLNLERESVLFESATPDNELFLCLYEIQAEKKTTIVSYPNNVFSKYLSGEYGFLGYFYPLFSKTESRQLNAKWLDKDTISYVDFVTRKEVIKKAK